MKKLVIGLSAAGMSLIAGAVAMAQPMGGQPGPMADKTVTKAEAQTMAATMFDRMDANKDGKLDASDRTARQAERQTQMFDRLDSDKNGAISREEFAGGKGKWDEARKQRRAERGGRGEHRPGMMMGKMADANHDGVVTREEMLAAHARHFEQADTDKDGRLTPAERQAARQHMREGMQEHGKEHKGHGPHALPAGNKPAPAGN